MDLYHADLGLPEGFKAPIHVIRPVYSAHAIDERYSDRYGTLELPKTIALRECQVIEVGMENGKVAKILFRVSYNDELDMCFVVIPGRWVVKTLWLNEKNDLHKTLDKSKYVAV